jgi:hypothetical protein
MDDNQKRKEIIINYLKGLGYPNIPPQVVFDNLTNIWKLLDDNVLIPQGMTFKQFQDIALHQYNEELMWAQWGQFMQPIHKKETKVF